MTEDEIRADERERIAAAIEAERDRRKEVMLDALGDRMGVRMRALTAAAQIARGGSHG